MVDRTDEGRTVAINTTTAERRASGLFVVRGNSEHSTVFLYVFVFTDRTEIDNSTHAIFMLNYPFHTYEKEGK